MESATKGGGPTGPGFKRFKGFRRGGIALRAMRFYILLREMKTKQPPFGRKKQANRDSPVGNAPLLPTAPLHGKASHEIFSRLMAPYKFRSLATPEGEVLAGLCLEVLMSTEAERRANFPLRGGKGTGFVGSRRRLRIQ